MTVSSLRVAVITPYYREPAEYLQRCLQSVAAQTHAFTHFLISDGHPSQLVAGWPVRHVQLGSAHADYGDTPRAVGSLLAASEGFEAIAYLDADNYYLPQHIAGLVAAWEAQGRQIDVLASSRFFVYPDGRLMPIADTMDPRRGVDTNCLFLAGNAIAHGCNWNRMPAAFHAFGDRIFWLMLAARGMRMGTLAQPSVAYTSNWKAHYQQLGEMPPPDAKDLSQAVVQACRWWHALTQPERDEHTARLGFDPTAWLASLLTDTTPHP